MEKIIQELNKVKSLGITVRRVIDFSKYFTVNFIDQMPYLVHRNSFGCIQIQKIGNVAYVIAVELKIIKPFPYKIKRACFNITKKKFKQRSFRLNNIIYIENDGFI